MKVTFIQTEYVLGDKSKNLKIIEKETKKAKGDLVVFPEMFLTGYGIREGFFAQAEDMYGPSVKKIQGFAKKYKKGIIFGMPRNDDKYRGNIYNSAFMILPDGTVAHYDKWFMANFGPFEEKEYFSKGKRLCIVETDWGRIGLIICFDIFFPELTKAYALAGADIVICISASPSATRVFFEKVLPARAIENTIFMLYSNIVGTDNNLVFWGGAQAYGPRGNQIARAEPFEQKNLTIDIDLEELKIARRNRPTLRDTRPEVFELALEEINADYTSF